MGSPEKTMAISYPVALIAIVAVWVVSFLGIGSICQWLGNQHSYGAHSRAQVSLAIALCCVSATWLLAEIIRVINPQLMSSSNGFSKVATEEPETIGAASTDVAENVEEGAANGKADEDRIEVSQQDELRSLTDRITSSLQELRAGAEMSGILAFMYVCDRTDIFTKAKKVYDPTQFWGCWAVICVVALFTMRKLDSAKPLQREQTDEWKGWMQLMFLMYHYFAEKEVYNAIRVYIAAYVFMTGFGNFSLYLKGKAFTIRRTMQMLFRLNFLGFMVCVGLNNEYMLYYICAMHTLFTVFVALALYIKNDLNTSSGALWGKIVVTFVSTILIYDTGSDVFKALFGTLPLVRPLFAFHDPLHPEFTDEMHEWHFRSGLDRFIWIFGMVFALFMPYFTQLIDWLQAQPGMKRHVWSLFVGFGVMVPFSVWVNYVFLLDKYSYNYVHPFTSAAPIVAYLLLRNLHAVLRQRYLFLFAYLGRYTLETYILQFHVWMKTTGLNGSPKHLLEWIPGSYFANFALVSAVYLFLSIRIANLTIVIRDALIPEELTSIAKRWACLAGASAACWIASYLFA